MEISVPLEDLLLLLDAADSWLEDYMTGIDDGTYDFDFASHLRAIALEDAADNARLIIKLSRNNTVIGG